MCEKDSDSEEQEELILQINASRLVSFSLLLHIERVVKCLDRYVWTKKKVQWILLGSDLEKVSLSSRFLRRQRRKSQNFC